MSDSVRKFMTAYGIQHRVSSVANPHANCRAELAVKTVKRMIRENVGMSGKLDQAKMSRALLQLRNTPDRDTGLSPAVALLGRQLRDFLPSQKHALMGDMWTNVLGAREEALAKRALMTHDRWTEKTKPLLPLRVGDHVLIQNQTGNHPKRWDKRGVIASCEGFDQYVVIVDGSRRLTRRNRKFLRRFEPYEAVGMPRKIEPTVNTAIDRSKNDKHTGKETFDANNPVNTRNMMSSSDTFVPRVCEEEHNATVEQSRKDRLIDDSPAVRIELPEPGVPAHVENEAVPVVDVNINTPSIRRSTRINRGRTSRYDDYET